MRGRERGRFGPRSLDRLRPDRRPCGQLARYAHRSPPAEDETCHLVENLPGWLVHGSEGRHRSGGRQVSRICVCGSLRVGMERLRFLQLTVKTLRRGAMPVEKSPISELPKIGDGPWLTLLRTVSVVLPPSQHDEDPSSPIARRWENPSPPRGAEVSEKEPKGQ